MTDDIEFLVSNGVGRDRADGSMIAVVVLKIPGVLDEFMMPVEKALSLGTSLLSGAIRAESDTLVVRALRQRGASREDCQAFLDSMRALDEDGKSE